MSVTAYEVPLISAPQNFQISLSNVLYRCTIYWCWPAQCWILDIYDNQLNPVVLGTPMVTGADILAQFKYLGIPGRMIVQSDFNTLAMPTFDNLGQGSHLYYVPFNQGNS